MKIKYIIIAKFKNDAIFETDGKRPEISESAVELMSVKRWRKRIFSENDFHLLREDSYFSRQFFVLARKLRSVDNLHVRCLAQLLQ